MDAYGISSSYAIALWVIVGALMSTLSVTLFLHRSLAHKSVIFHPVVNHIFRVWLWLTTGMSSKAWVAIHRKHHITTDKGGDPHSPVVYPDGTKYEDEMKGLRAILFGGAFRYHKMSMELKSNKDDFDRYGEGTPDDWLEKIYSFRLPGGWQPSILIWLLICYASFESLLVAVLVWAFQMIWIPMSAAGIINGLGHFWGYRNYELDNNSRNMPISILGIFLGGEELHNNHHETPSNPKFSRKWWEFDFGWLVLRMLMVFNLAQLRSKPSHEV